MLIPYQSRAGCAFALWLAVPAMAGPNLMLNPGFEEGQGNYAGVGKHWETNDALSHPDINFLTNVTSQSGSWSQYLRAHPTWDLGMVRQVSAYNSITPGKTYRVSAWVRTQNVGNPAGWYVFGIWWFNGADAYLSDVKMPQQETLNYDWREISYTVVAPAGAARVVAVLTRHTDGDAWYDDVSISEIDQSPPTISLTPTSLTREVIENTNLASDMFTVQNVGGQTLNYTIADNASWLSVTPGNGASTGEADIIAVNYNTASLPLGPYNATITVTATGATNTPQLIPVSLMVVEKPVPGDFDGDRDVDQSDFGRFQTCITGPGVQQFDLVNCANALLDGDVDVDQDDFGVFQGCFSGPDVEGDKHCDQ